MKIKEKTGWCFRKIETWKAKQIKDTPNNQSKATIIFSDLISKRKELMSKLYDSVDYNHLNFEYVGSTKDVIFYEYMDYKNFLM